MRGGASCPAYASMVPTAPATQRDIDSDGSDSEDSGGEQPLRALHEADPNDSVRTIIRRLRDAQLGEVSPGSKGKVRLP